VLRRVAVEQFASEHVQAGAYLWTACCWRDGHSAIGMLASYKACRTIEQDVCLQAHLVYQFSHALPLAPPTCAATAQNRLEICRFAWHVQAWAR
jgi:hypothetical protein